MNPYDKLTDVQKALYEGYDKGWSEREKRFKIESENAIKKVLSESKTNNIEVFAGHILREIGIITNDLERELNEPKP